MRDEFLERYVREYIERQDTAEVGFAWRGGEPTLMGVEFFRRVVTLRQQYANGKRITNAFQTNGVLLNAEWCEFFKQHDFLIGLSVEGPPKLRDHYRVDKGGNRPLIACWPRGTS